MVPIDRVCVRYHDAWIYFRDRDGEKGLFVLTYDTDLLSRTIREVKEDWNLLLSLLRKNMVNSRNKNI